MYSATVLLTVQKFVPMNGVVGQSPSIVATIAPPQDISPPPHPATPVFSGDGQSITITVPKGYEGLVQLIYQLPDPRYVMLGAAFQGPNQSAGQLEFRDVDLNRDLTGSQMVVTDSCDPQFYGVEFSYVILIQEVATGNIGLIDPGVETEEE
jgi:hypothetical protein